MFGQHRERMADVLAEIRDAGLYKSERVIVTPQAASIQVSGGAEVINFCANNYLGLSDNPELIEAAKATMARRDIMLSGTGDAGERHEAQRKMDRRSSSRRARS